MTDLEVVDHGLLVRMLGLHSGIVHEVSVAVGGARGGALLSRRGLLGLDYLVAGKLGSS